MNFIVNFVSSLSLQHIQMIVFFVVLIIICSIIVFIIVSYFLIKLLKIGIDDNNVLFYNYNKGCQRLLDLYGDCELTKIYLVRQPLSKPINFLLNLLTLFNYDKMLSQTKHMFPHHIKFVIEVKLTNGFRKWLVLEKNNCVNISEYFYVNETQEMKLISLPVKGNGKDAKKKKYTLNNILKTTQQRIGVNKFFNWHIYKNNCKAFITEVLKSIGKYNKKHHDFIFGDIPMDKLMNVIVPTELASHIVNSLVNITNLFEKYILDNSLFC